MRMLPGLTYPDFKNPARVMTNGTDTFLVPQNLPTKPGQHQVAGYGIPLVPLYQPQDGQIQAFPSEGLAHYPEDLYQGVGARRDCL